MGLLLVNGGLLLWRSHRPAETEYAAAGSSKEAIKVGILFSLRGSTAAGGPAFTSFPDMARTRFPWLPGRWLVRNRYDNIGKLASCRGPVFIAHSPQDSLIPFDQGERLFAAAPEPKRFFPMPNYHHNDLPITDFYPALRRFLAECEGKDDDAP